MPDSSRIPDMLLTPAEVADYLSVTEASLGNDRYNGVGVPFIKIGSRVRYRLSALLEYLDDCAVEPQPVPLPPANRPARTHKMRRV